MGSSMTLSHLTLSDLERSNSRGVTEISKAYISRKAAELGHILLLNTNRISYMGSPKPPSHWTVEVLNMI